MQGITVWMAIVDFIPVVLFFIAAVILQRDLYDKLVKGAYSLLAAGSIMVLVGGFFKALWKALYALNVCDYVLLDHSFFPMQGPGFLIFFAGLLGLFYTKDKNVKAYSAAPLVFTGTLPFIVMQILGLGGAHVSLTIFSIKNGNKKAPYYLAVAFVAMFAMGYLGAKFDNSSNMHWIAQLTNIVSMGAFLLGTISIHKTLVKNA
ncbi:MAG: hypothetical protein MJ113_02190 [Lachnospiraceae bacterium]|nr:hypothetical protein [Lachnospiraceae bacterium]